MICKFIVSFEKNVLAMFLMNFSLCLSVSLYLCISVSMSLSLSISLSLSLSVTLSRMFEATVCAGCREFNHPTGESFIRPGDCYGFLI